MSCPASDFWTVVCPECTESVPFDEMRGEQCMDCWRYAREWEAERRAENDGFGADSAALSARLAAEDMDR